MAITNKAIEAALLAYLEAKAAAEEAAPAKKAALVADVRDLLEAARRAGIEYNARGVSVSPKQDLVRVFGEQFDTHSTKPEVDEAARVKGVERIAAGFDVSDLEALKRELGAAIGYEETTEEVVTRG